MIRFEIEEHQKVFDQILQTEKDLILIGSPLHPKLELLFEKAVEYFCELYFFEDKKTAFIVDHQYYQNFIEEKIKSAFYEQYSYISKTVEEVSVFNISSQSDLDSLKGLSFDFLFLTKEFSSNILESINCGEKTIIVCLDYPESAFFLVDDQMCLKVLLYLSDINFLEIDEDMLSLDNIRLIQGTFEKK